MPGQQSATESPLAGDAIRADFRSDTVTRATPAMREAMAKAEVGDDVYGEDPTVNALQDRLAEMTRKEAGLYFPSGTQSNLAAVLSHCGRGDEYLIGRNSHVLLNEAGGTAALGGAVPWILEVDKTGAFTPEAVHLGVKEPDQHHPPTRLLCLENTCNGHVQTVDHLAACAAAAREHDLAVHLDGARLFNAANAEGVGIDCFAKHVDTVSLCLSKGLGAPIGTVLVGDRGSIDQAFRLRKMLGGGTRQVGHLAAAGMHALDHHVAGLADDHARAARIANGLAGVNELDVVLATNMLWITPADDHHDMLVDHLIAHGILACFWKPTMRFVTHLDIGDDAVDLLVSTVRDFYA
ncbi:MAG: low-specificity L-threonine aldolase [Acidimicrobiaceae bacterium]|nr:low-specificity L-threonine aldolase [Acidimicrobiaceae bacterium]|tara:strand:- start:1278 stop:2330 length:1053 start_codon:yes stop_codon:yes gene_type:complete